MTNIGLTVPTIILSVTPSSITSSGTFVITLTTQTANTVFAGPTSGVAATPTFRSLVVADLPLTFGNLTDVGTDGITIGNGSGSVIGSGTTISQHVADTTHNGYLDSTDWNTFNGKQAALTFGNLTDSGTDGITVGNGSGSVIGSGTTISQHVASATNNGYLDSSDWSTFNGKQATLTIGNLTDTGTDGITVTGGSGAVIGSGTSIAQHVADTTHNGYLDSTDWNTFNGKQASGSYITALAGDVTASGPGSAAATLATVNSDVGTFTNASLTVNAKGLITAASNGTAPFTPIAPTIQIFSSGSGTYTTPTSPSPLYLVVQVMGDGGGGGSADTNGGTNGSGSTFGSAMIAASGGIGGFSGSSGTLTGGPGGTPTISSPAIDLGSVAGGYGGGANATSVSVTNFVSGPSGGNGFFGGAGTGATNSVTTSPGTPNTGGGGAGGSTAQASNVVSGTGGGSGAYAIAQVNSPASTYSYSVGPGGTGGSSPSGTLGPGTDGGSGIIIVREFYQ